MPLTLLQRLLSKYALDQKTTAGKETKKSADLLVGFNSLNMGDTVMAFLLNISSKTDLSPKGFIAIEYFIHDSIQIEYKAFVQKIFKSCLKLLCSLIRDN
mmetsp:Transcript_36954/g.35666  ORF Transcript_36954/g.35666 Transcript_36954/m.35666 type:complete len:100 (+) Transcript_36954:2359-2658(+)